MLNLEVSYANWNLEFQFSIDKCKYNSKTKRTNARVQTSFKWNGCPLVKMRDVLGTAYNNWYVEGYTANIKYISIYGANDFKWKVPTFVTGPNGGINNGAGYSFMASIENNYYWASEGFEIYSLSCSGAKDLYAVGKYADRSVSATPSLSFSGSGGAIDINISETSSYYSSYAQRKVNY